MYSSVCVVTGINDDSDTAEDSHWHTASGYTHLTLNDVALKHCTHTVCESVWMSLLFYSMSVYRQRQDGFIDKNIGYVFLLFVSTCKCEHL